MARMLGDSLLLLSCIAWGLLLLVPLSSVSTEQKLASGAGLYIFGQVTWSACRCCWGANLSTEAGAAGSVLRPGRAGIAGRNDAHR